MGENKLVRVEELKLSGETKDFLRKMSDTHVAATDKQTMVLMEMSALLSQLTNPGPSATDVMLRGELGSRVDAIYEHCRACWEHENTSAAPDGEATSSPADCADSGCMFHKFRPMEQPDAKEEEGSSS
jgi:hypothetical protein